MLKISTAFRLTWLRLWRRLDHSLVSTLLVSLILAALIIPQGILLTARSAALSSLNASSFGLANLKIDFSREQQPSVEELNRFANETDSLALGVYASSAEYTPSTRFTVIYLNPNASEKIGLLSHEDIRHLHTVNQGILLDRSFALAHDLNEGDMLHLQTKEAKRSLVVAGTLPQGYFMSDASEHLGTGVVLDTTELGARRLLFSLFLVPQSWTDRIQSKIEDHFGEVPYVSFIEPAGIDPYLIEAITWGAKAIAVGSLVLVVLGMYALYRIIHQRGHIYGKASYTWFTLGVPRRTIAFSFFIEMVVLLCLAALVVAVIWYFARGWIGELIPGFNNEVGWLGIILLLASGWLFLLALMTIAAARGFMVGIGNARSPRHRVGFHVVGLICSIIGLLMTAAVVRSQGVGVSFDVELYVGIVFTMATIAYLVIILVHGIIGLFSFLLRNLRLQHSLGAGLICGALVFQGRSTTATLATILALAVFAFAGLGRVLDTAEAVAKQQTESYRITWGNVDEVPTDQLGPHTYKLLIGQTSLNRQTTVRAVGVDRGSIPMLSRLVPGLDRTTIREVIAGNGALLSILTAREAGITLGDVITLGNGNRIAVLGFLPIEYRLSQLVITASTLENVVQSPPTACVVLPLDDDGGAYLDATFEGLNSRVISQTITPSDQRIRQTLSQISSRVRVAIATVIALMIVVASIIMTRSQNAHQLINISKALGVPRHVLIIVFVLATVLLFGTAGTVGGLVGGTIGNAVIALFEHDLLITNIVNTSVSTYAGYILLSVLSGCVFVTAISVHQISRAMA